MRPRGSPGEGDGGVESDVQDKTRQDKRNLKLNHRSGSDGDRRLKGSKVVT